MNQDHIHQLKNQALSVILSASSLAELETFRIKFLGRNGNFSKLLKEIPALPETERGEVGKQANEAKAIIQNAITEKNHQLANQPASQTDQNATVLATNLSTFDPTIPGINPSLGHCHPVTQAIEEIARIFENIGFTRIRYPEITTDWYCFEGVNVPPDHPSRDDQETFFLENGLVLSTHTTSGLLQEVERLKAPPIRMLHIAKCYRRQIDVSHTPMFHQFEGWLLDKEVNIGHLKWTLDYFAKQYFGANRITRLRPHHFQYTEPSFEVDITCGACTGKGCRFCKEGWTELGGSGMAHPNMIRNAGLDPSEISGFGFGWGVERVLAMRSGIDDIRQLYANNYAFLEQF